MFRIVSILGALALLAAAPAAAQPSREAAMFGARESASSVELSPSGRYLVFIAPAAGASSVAVIADLQSSAQARPILRSSGNPDHLQWCRFASDSRLICSIRGVAEVTGVEVPYSRLVVIDSDGSNLRQLGQRPSAYDTRLRQFDGAILDWLPDDGRAVLMAREYVPEGELTGSRMSRRLEGLGVDRIDLETLRATQVLPPDRRASGYLTDGRGNVRIMRLARTDGDGQASSRTDYQYRGESGGWRAFSSYDSGSREGMIPIAVDGASNSAYVLRKLGGRFALYRVRLEEGLPSELVYANDEVDVDDVVRVGRSGPIIGATFADEVRRTVWFDPRYRDLAQTLSRAIPNLPMIDFAGASRDGTKLLVFAGSDNDPGRYFVYDSAAPSLNEIMLVRPELERVRLANVRPVSYPAADGVSVPGYLTLPPGREDARGLPAIVLPHGGPSARDEWGFDWLPQFLANRGYAVLQPNFRGSEGYGDEWFADNGFRGWQTSIGDVTAGGRWLLSQGADPQRLAIVGWSYGGYAALQSGVVEPGLFKAIVAIAPVTDFAMTIQESEGYSNYRLVRDFIGSGPHLEQGSPLRNAERIRAPVLMFHGTRDFNVRIAQAREMQRALEAAGRPSRLTVFDELEHNLGDSAARARMLDEIAAFLAASLGD